MARSAQITTPTYFATPEAFRRWLQKHCADALELWVGFYKVGTGRKSITWPESVDEALCVGWIDGLRRGIDADSYMIRFSPRRSGSTWSEKNIRRMQELIEAGRVNDAGLVAFETRKENRSGVYSYEQRPVELPEPYASAMRSNRRASTFFHRQAPWYRRAAIWWVISAKRPETRERRLNALLDDCEAGRVIPLLRRPDGKT